MTGLALYSRPTWLRCVLKGKEFGIPSEYGTELRFVDQTDCITLAPQH
jgi:hypothetical protein